MLPQWIRVFYSDNGTLTDYSIAAQNSELIPMAVTAAQDYVYVGQYFPFNNLYFEMDVANTNTSDVSVQYWNGKIWTSARDILDGTKMAGKSLARSGVIQWSPDRTDKWLVINDTTDGGNPSELASLEIYNLYWMRFKWSADLSGTTSVNNIAYSFCTNEMLRAIDPEIDNYLTAWGGASKTNWNEQIMLASQEIVFNLKSRGLILAVGDILRFDDVSLATCYRCLSIILRMLGQPFAAKRQDYQIAESELLAVKRFSFDTNSDAVLDKGEISNSVSKLVR